MLAEQAGRPFTDDQLARNRVITAMIDSSTATKIRYVGLNRDLVTA